MRNPAKDRETEKLAAELVDAALKVHRNLGPGLLETVYETCLCQELRLREIPFKRQISVPIIYEGVTLDAGLRLDVVVADRIVVEIKAVERLIPLFDAQVLTYLKLTGMELGLLINFNVPLIKNGIRRIVL
ncbi:MAG: GxxExxY protein [Betaproteobacteria bacterium]